jgi:PAS domain S-box-containing protein
MSNTHEWCRRTISTQIKTLQDIKTEALPWWRAQLLNKETINIYDVDALPPEAHHEKMNLKDRAYALSYSPYDQGMIQVVGFIGFDSVHEKKMWKQEQIALLKIVAEIINNAFIKQHAEETIRTNEEKFRQLAENIEEVFWLRSADNTKIIYISPAYEKIWQRTCESLYENPDSFMESIYEKDKNTVFEAFDNYRRGGKFDLEYRIVRPSGQIRWIWARSFPVFDKKGKTIRHTGVAIDVTERNEIEEELYATTKLLEGTMDAIPDIISIQKPDHTILRYNKAGYDFLGMNPNQTIGKKCFELLGNEKSCNGCAAEVSLKTKKMARTEKYIPESGTYLDCTANPILDREGDVHIIIEQIRDITDKKKSEIALKTQKEKIEKQLYLTERLFKMPNMKPDYLFFAEELRNLSGSNFVLFNLYDEKGERFKTKSVSAQKRRSKASIMHWVLILSEGNGGLTPDWSIKWKMVSY